MAITLVKGQRVAIQQGLTQIKVEMGWKVNPSVDPPYDLDASTFLLGERGMIEHEADFVFYGSGNTCVVDADTRPVSMDKSVLGSVDDLGDDDDGTGEGHEEIDVDLTRTSPRVREILFSASIYFNPNNESDPRRKYNFGQVRDAYIQISNAVTGETICRYDLDEDFSTDKGVEFGRLYRKGDDWKFQAVGEAHETGLESICHKYVPAKFMM